LPMKRNAAVLWCGVLLAVACLPGGARGAGGARDAGPAQTEKGQKEESGKRPAGTARSDRGPADAGRETDRLLQENVQLRDRIRALEQQAGRTQQLEDELAALKAREDAARDQAEAHHRAVAASLSEFFE